MFPIKKQFQEQHINKLLVFSEGPEVLKGNGGQVHTETQSHLD